MSHSATTDHGQQSSNETSLWSRNITGCFGKVNSGIGELNVNLFFFIKFGDEVNIISTYEFVHLFAEQSQKVVVQIQHTRPYL